MNIPWINVAVPILFFTTYQFKNYEKKIIHNEKRYYTVNILPMPILAVLLNSGEGVTTRMSTNGPTPVPHHETPFKEVYMFLGTFDTIKYQYIK